MRSITGTSEHWQTFNMTICVQAVMHKQGLKACSMIYGSTTPLQSLSELSDMGYHMVFRPLSGKQPLCHLFLHALATRLSCMS